MAWSNFLNHTCDIYHIRLKGKKRGYNLKDSTEYTYGDTPDLKEMKCHFSLKKGQFMMQQTDPLTKLVAYKKLSLPYGTDIRVLDKIVHKETGIEYIAEEPQEVSNKHHIVVMVRRTSVQEPVFDMKTNEDTEDG